MVRCCGVCACGGGWVVVYVFVSTAGRYFAKQGFSKTLTLRKKQWEGLIKHYDGANLMECAINHDVDYTAVPLMLRWQRDFLYNTVRSRTQPQRNNHATTTYTHARARTRAHADTHARTV